MHVAAEFERARLERRLGFADAAALIVSNVIGVGIFTTPGIVARLVPRPGLILAAWLAGGMLALAGARAYAELAGLVPRAGGEYVYLREAFGPLAGFLSGWTSFIAGFSGAIAAGAIGLASYLGRLIPITADTRPLLSLPPVLRHVELSPRSITAIAVIFLFSALHARGLGVGRMVQNALATLVLGALLLLVIAGFSSGTGSAENLQAGLGPAGAGNWLLALIPIMFTYSGWNAATYVAEEVRRPERNMMRAAMAGTAAVVALYLALNLLYLFALSPARLANVINAGDAAADALFGAGEARVASAIVVVALAAGISAMILAGPRVYFSMGRDGVFVPAAGRVHRRFRTPAAAIVGQAVWSAVLVLTGGFEQLLIYTGFAVVLFSALAVLSLFILRRKFADRARPAGKVSSLGSAIFVVAMLALAADVFLQRPATAITGVALIAAGIPIFWWRRRRLPGEAS